MLGKAGVLLRHLGSSRLLSGKDLLQGYPWAHIKGSKLNIWSERRVLIHAGVQYLYIVPVPRGGWVVSEVHPCRFSEPIPWVCASHWSTTLVLKCHTQAWEWEEELSFQHHWCSMVMSACLCGDTHHGHPIRKQSTDFYIVPAPQEGCVVSKLQPCRVSSPCPLGTSLVHTWGCEWSCPFSTTAAAWWGASA